MERFFWHLPRWVNRIIARLGGYFWLPCPLCGEMFGGHEWDGRIGHYKVDPENFILRIGEGCCQRHPDVPPPGYYYQLPGGQHDTRHQ